jgi:hypothetical protein
MHSDLGLVVEAEVLLGQNLLVDDDCSRLLG